MVTYRKVSIPCDRCEKRFYPVIIKFSSEPMVSLEGTCPHCGYGNEHHITIDEIAQDIRDLEIASGTYSGSNFAEIEIRGRPQ